MIFVFYVVFVLFLHALLTLDDASLHKFDNVDKWLDSTIKYDRLQHDDSGWFHSTATLFLLFNPHLYCL